MTDERFMDLALSLGRRGLGSVWPNPAVGCVIVQGGRIVGRGWTQPGGRPHAEVVALAQAADQPVPQLDTITVPHLEVSEDSLQQAMAAHGLNTQRPVLGLCPGAEFGPAKRWPEHHYAAVAQHWIEHGGQVWIFGSGKDQPVADTIVELLENSADEHATVLAGNTSLEQAVDLLSATTAVVSNDSGLMHIAAALKRPLVAVYGSTSPGFTPPLGDRVAVVRLGLECSPCFERECPLGHLNCLRQLPPSQVIDALQQLESADA